MPAVNLSDLELADLVMAARAAAWRASQDALAQANSVADTPFRATAQRYEALAEKLERARIPVQRIR